MGKSFSRLLAACLLLLLLPLQAQEIAPTERYKINYKRFTRGKNAKVQDEAAGRLEWFRERMGGDLGPDFANRLLTQAELERAKYPALFPSTGGPLRPLAAGGTTWVSLGPTSSNFTQNSITLTKVDSGRLRTILPDPADATGNTVLLLAAGGGLWKTTDFLSTPPTWTPLTDFVGSNMSGSAAFGRTSSTLYVGAGDPFDVGVGGFMIRSTDGGVNWSSHAALGTAIKVMDVKVDLSQGTTQVSDIVLVGTNVGLFRSTNGGSTYTAVATATGVVWSIVNTSAGWLLNTVASTGVGTLRLSTDRGATWAPISNAGTVYTGAGRTTLAVGTPGDAIVYAFAGKAGTSPFGEPDQQDLYRSTDGGQTWKALHINSMVPIGSSPKDQPNMDLMHGQAWYNQMLLVDPSDGARNTVYLGGDLSSARSTDGGTSWTIISNWIPDPFSGTGSLPYIHADFHCAAYSNFAGTARLYFGGDGGIFTSTDGGATWDDTKNKGLVNHLLYSLVSNPATTGSALCGMQDLGVRLRVGSTSVFNQVQGGDGFGVGWSQTGNAMSLSSYVYNAIVACTSNPPDDQTKFNDFITGLGTTGYGTGGDNGTSYYFVTPIITPPGPADPSGQVFFTYGNSNNGLNSSPTAGPNSGKIFKSSSSAWSTIATPGSGGMTANRFVRAVSHGIGVSPVDLQHIAAAENGGYVLLTADGGTSWTEAFLGAEPTTPGQVAGWQGFNANIAWANNSLLYVCSEAVTAGATRVAKSANGGATWIRADAGLPDVPVTKLAVDPGDASGNTVYAATWLGMYRTTNGGTAWSIFGTGLPQGRVTDIWMAPNSATVRVSTWGRGIWELQPVTGSGPSVTLNPPAVLMVQGGTQAFTPTVAGGAANTVTWSASAGSIAPGPTGTGLAQTYTAPASGTSATVTATTVDTPQALAAATITLVASSAVSVAVSPAVVDVITTSGSQQFSAVVTAAAVPLTNGAVTWSVSGGTGLSGSGLFSAGSLSAGSYTVTATSQAAPSRSGTALVHLLAPAAVAVSVSPATITLAPGGSHQFTALVTGPTQATNQTVTWSTSGGGTITPSGGLFTATTAVGSPFTITATNPFSGRTGTATVNVVTLDLNGDGVVNPLDLLTFAKHYNTTNPTCLFTGDTTVGEADLSALLAGM
jgi:hypothetical protein